MWVFLEIWIIKIRDLRFANLKFNYVCILYRADISASTAFINP